MAIVPQNLNDDLKNSFVDEDGSVLKPSDEELASFWHEAQPDDLSSGESTTRVKKFFDYLARHVFLPWIRALTDRHNREVADRKEAVADEAAARDTAIAAAVADEASARNTAIEAAVADEASARNTAIGAAVLDEAAARNAAIAAAVADEASARNTAIGAAVSDEEAARNTAIGAAVADEASARNTAIAAAVSDEAAARNAAIEAAVADEASARSARDTTLWNELQKRIFGKIFVIEAFDMAGYIQISQACSAEDLMQTERYLIAVQSTGEVYFGTPADMVRILAEQEPEHPFIKVWGFTAAAIAAGIELPAKAADVAAAIAAAAADEASARNTAIGAAVADEASARNTAIAAAVSDEAAARNAAITKTIKAYGTEVLPSKLMGRPCISIRTRGFGELFATEALPDPYNLLFEYTDDAGNLRTVRLVEGSDGAEYYQPAYDNQRGGWVWPAPDCDDHRPGPDGYSLFDLLQTDGVLYYGTDDRETVFSGTIWRVERDLSDDIAGLEVDFENKICTRLGAAAGKEAGADFNLFRAFGGRRRCNVADNGAIKAYYGDVTYTEDGSNGQVMVYQPAFWYKVSPVKKEANSAGAGYNLRKVRYYVSAAPRTGFKLHPAFYDGNGNPVDYILLSAYEGSMYDASVSAYVNDSVDTDIAYADGDLLCSVSGKKPISGLRTGMGTRANFESMAQNRGGGWHLETIKAYAAQQLLMIVEGGKMNTQDAFGLGVVSITDNSNYNCASLTGSTAGLGNKSGSASATVNEIGGAETSYNAAGKVAITYRGVENPWGNIFKHLQGVTVYGDGTLAGGVPYICDDLTHFGDVSGNEHYQSPGFSLAAQSGNISTLGYGSEDYDWLLAVSESQSATNTLFGDGVFVTANLNNEKSVQVGGPWRYSGTNGGFNWWSTESKGYRARDVGGRLLYVPTASV